MSGTHDPAAIREDIEATRREMGDTVEALAAKTDVKSQAKAKVEHVIGKAKEASPDSASSSAQQLSRKARENPIAAAAAGAFVAGYLAGRLRNR